MLSMDNQRFDLNKRPRNNFCHFALPTIGHEENSELRDTLSLLEFFSSCSGESSITAASSDMSHQVFSNLVLKVSSLPDDLDAPNYDVFEKQCHTPSPEILTTPCSSPIIELEDDSPSDSDIENDQTMPVDNLLQSKEEAETINEYTCTIMRPRPRSPIFNIFSRPSSPISLTSRPGSPINFGSLNCFGNNDNFEEDVEILQAQRTKKIEIRVFVTETRELTREETWRAPLTELLYGPKPGGQPRAVAFRD
ncbi:hypothetical protein E4T56_gene7561 [Termitomyces sp. T112]|nr:hypothetical protein E4T56_gene7561 [Termitomyces sp. T112]